MSDLISRKALCEYALNQKDKSITPNEIMRFPSAEPVRHGKWIHRGGGIFICDKCGRGIGINAYTHEKASERFKYCPNCGARMDTE